MENYPSFQSLISGTIFQVSEVNSRIKDIIADSIGTEFIWVVGEVTGFRGHHASGHWYFSLRDNKSQISAVCFKWANQHIKFLPEDGMEVICCGQIGVYEKQGVYQINIRYIEPKGVGAQAIALEQLKDKLAAEGLFDQSRKRQTPFLSRKIGIVTSPTGAAVRDILKVLYRRFPNIHTVISPASVQGNKAPAEIVEALDRLYGLKGLDLIILARGGGSKEDLWVFNEESIARMLSRSPVPVITAVGHETDFSISDMVADVSASTPSMAAEIAVREAVLLEKELNELNKRLDYSLKNISYKIEQLLTDYHRRLKWALSGKVEGLQSELATLIAKLDSLSPLKVLERGYSITYKQPDNIVIKNSAEISRGDSVLIRFKTGKAICTVDETQN